jgi:hypothetical protein
VQLQESAVVWSNRQLKAHSAAHVNCSNVWGEVLSKQPLTMFVRNFDAPQIVLEPHRDASSAFRPLDPKL